MQEEHHVQKNILKLFLKQCLWGFTVFQYFVLQFFIYEIFIGFHCYEVAFIASVYDGGAIEDGGGGATGYPSGGVTVYSGGGATEHAEGFARVYAG